MLFSTDWTHEEEDVVGNVMETIDDYLQDMSKWISTDYYVGIIMKNLFTTVVINQE